MYFTAGDAILHHHSFETLLFTMNPCVVGNLFQCHFLHYQDPRAVIYHILFLLSEKSAHRGKSPNTKRYLMCTPHLHLSF